jgi:hypothetical protein
MANWWVGGIDVGLRFRWECPWSVVCYDDVVGSEMKIQWDFNNDGFAMKPAGRLGGGKAGQARFEIRIWRARDWMIPKLGDRLDQNQALVWLWLGKRSFGNFNVRRTARANRNFRKH